MGTLAWHYVYIHYRSGGGGGWYARMKMVILSRANISMFKHGGIFFEIMGMYCNASRLSCRVVRNVMKILNMWFNWVHSRVYFDIIM